jgi:hypothetical protein
MSTLTLLPLLQVTDGVQTNEDWRLSIAFYLDDGVTPIPLVGLNFDLTVGAFATLTSGGGQLVVSGPSNNVLVITALASEKATWPSGIYPISLVANDGVYNRDLFASSTLAVGGAQLTSITLIVAPDSVSRSVAAPISAALSSAFQALQPSALTSAIEGAPSSNLAALAQALFAALPVQTGSSAPVASGQAFINSSGFAVIAP